MGVVGRADEVAGVRAAVGAVRSGRTQVLVVEGEAGIGKTTILDVLAGLCTGSGVKVLRGAAAELEADRPFGPLIDALDLDPRSRDPQRRALAAVVEGRPPVGGGGLGAQVPEARYRAVDALCSFVDSMAHEPVALLLDDLHWADEATLLAVRRLGRSTGVPLLLAVTSRPPDPGSPAAATLDAVATAAGARRLELPPLGRTDVRALLTELLDGPPGPRLVALAEGAGGNPLFLTELIDVLRHDGSLRAEGSGVDVADGAATADLARRLRARAARLGSAAGALVRVGAVLGTTFTLDEAARTGGWSAADLVGPLEELLRAGLLVDDAGRLRFRHDLLRRAIEDELPPTARRALHVAAGRALAEAGTASPARIARHLAFGARPGDAEAVRWLHQAAREAAARAPAAAVTLLDDALALVAPYDPVRMTLLTERVEALGWSGRNAEAEALARELLEAIEDRDARVALRRQLALALFVGNRPMEAKAECERSAADTLDDPAQHAQALAEGSLAAMAVGLIDEATSLSDAAIEEGRAHDAAGALSIALCVRSRLLAFGGRFEEGLEASRAGLAAVGDDDGEVGRYQPGMFVILSLNDVDRYDELADLLTAERRLAEERGIVWAIPLHHAAAATRHYNLGELADAVAEATTGLTVADDSGATLASVWLHAVLALVALHRGDLAGAETHVAGASESLVTVTPLLGVDLFALAQARLAEAQRDLATAAAVAGGAWDLFEAMGVTGGLRNVAVDVVRLAGRTGDGDLAARAAAALERVAAATELASDVAAARYARGVADGEAAALLDAVHAFTLGVHPLRRAWVAEDAAQALWAAGRKDDASVVLTDAQRTWADAGATADARRAAATFSTLGLRRPPAHDRPTAGWESLTPTERRVTSLVATGAPNAIIATELGISRRTVETHLRHVYAKVGVASRVELAVGALQRDELTTARAAPARGAT